MKHLALAVAGIVLCCVSNLSAEPVLGSDATYRYYKANAKIHSWHPDNLLGTYKKHSSGSCCLGASVGLGVGNDLHVNITSGRAPKSFTTEVVVTSILPGESKETIVKKTFAMQSLEVHRMELYKDSEGKVYELLLTPEIIVAKTARVFASKDSQPESWDFRSSSVILNDSVYLGSMGICDSTFVGVDVAGLPTCEFSLIPWKGSKPTGLLSDGTLTLKSEDHTLMIRSVRNGSPPQMLKDGPYFVWVKWTEPELSTAEIQALVKERIEFIKQQKNAGNKMIPPELLHQFQEFIDSGKPMLSGSHGHDLQEHEMMDAKTIKKELKLIKAKRKKELELWNTK